MSIIKFPNDFEFGTATAAYQIEGAWNEDGKGENIWDRFTHVPGHIQDKTNGDITCDFYHRYKEDIRLAKKLGIEVFRLSVNWARILPDGQGEVNLAGIEFYRNVLREIRENNMKVCLTIYHWDLPQKLQDKGGWANRDIVKWYTDYAEILFLEYGNDVDYWITINEPYCIAFLGYWTGEHAPGLHDYSTALQAVHHLLLAHGAAVKKFRSCNLSSEIGITLNMGMACPENAGDGKDVEAARRSVMAGNCLFGDPVYLGRYPEELFEFLDEKGVVLPEIREGDMELINQKLDFFGLNTYTAGTIKYDASQWPLETGSVGSGRERTEAGWEVWPEMFYELLSWIDNRYGHPAIIITENGAANNDWVDSQGKVADSNRIEYLKRYLKEVSRAVDNGISVKGYYVWCFTDNFEWAYGEARRFGIVYVDYKSQKRIPKESAKWFSGVIKEKGFEIKE